MIKIYMKLTFSFIIVLLISRNSGLHAAELKLATIFSDHMVLQCDKPLTVWGWADPDESVTVSFGGQSKSVITSVNGKWFLKLDPSKASAKSQELIARGKEGRKVIVKDVLVGEVWFGSGQSNMAMAVGSANNFEAEKAAANLPLIRYYSEASLPADKPQAKGKGKWEICSPESVRRFSATLYFFGREIHREVGVPVGLVTASAGATHIESWLSAEVQSSDPDTKGEYEAQLKAWVGFDEAKFKADYEKKLAAWKFAFSMGKSSEKDKPSDPDRMIAHIKGKGGPSGLFNARVFNLAPFTLRGIIWYQGESNSGLPGSNQKHLYHKQLSLLVTSWRELWGDELPFAWVQLPNFTAPGEGWPRIREAMLKALELPKTGMAITIDIGDEKDIHPKNKQEVGKRLSYWALGTVYGKKVPAISGPLPTGSTISGNSITVSFKHTNGGLKSINGGPLAGFQIAGADQQWKPAVVEIKGDSVVVTSPLVAQPVSVRYAWKDLPDCSLANGAGLPASPFRTDDWPVPQMKK